MNVVSNVNYIDPSLGDQVVLLTHSRFGTNPRFQTRERCHEDFRGHERPDGPTKTLKYFLLGWFSLTCYPRSIRGWTVVSLLLWLCVRLLGVLAVGS